MRRKSLDQVDCQLKILSSYILISQILPTTMQRNRTNTGHFRVILESAKRELGSSIGHGRLMAKRSGNTRGTRELFKWKEIQIDIG